VGRSVRGSLFEESRDPLTQSRRVEAMRSGMGESCPISVELSNPADTAATTGTGVRYHQGESPAAAQ
jgi:hypothetical protein